MNKFILITISSSILGLLAITLSFCYGLQLGMPLKSFEAKSLCQATMPPPLSMSPDILLLLGFLLLTFFGLRRKK